MPRPKSACPSLRLHKPSGRAVVTLDGQDHYLGIHGTAEATIAYGELIKQWKDGTLPNSKPEAKPQTTIMAVCAEFWRIVEKEGLYMKKSGRVTSERRGYKTVIAVLLRKFGNRLAASFTKNDLRDLREAFAKPARGTKKVKLMRSTVNSYTSKVVSLFHIAAEYDLVPVDVYQNLRVVRPIKKNKGGGLVLEPKRVLPVERERIDATLPHLSAEAKAIVEVMWHSGCRVGEAIIMRTGDLDRSDENAWLYTPQEHKTEDADKSREIWLVGPAIEAVKPFLRADPNAFMFEVALNPWPPQIFNKRIGDACKAGSVVKWTPHQIRHSWATRARKADGIEAAQVGLGHSSTDITERYAERDRSQAKATALKLVGKVG